MPSKSVSPHDKFFRSMMEHPKVIREFLDANLPSELKDALDYDSIKTIKTSFITDRLKEKIADVLLKAKCDDEDTYFYVLVEHQSTSQDLLPFRIDEYIHEIQKFHMKTNKTKKLPLVWPVVLYTGKSEYKKSMHPHDLYDVSKEKVEAIMKPPYKLIDLSGLPEEELSVYRMYGTMCRFFKHIHDPNILPFLGNVINETLRDIDKQGDIGYIEVVISYVYNAAKTIDHDDFKEVITKLDSVDEDKIMTLAQELKNRGRKEGIEQGIQQGAEQRAMKIANAMLQKGMTPAEISTLTELPVSKLEKLLKSKKLKHPAAA
ncbi:MAG: Rpn family recombination-promoting nuclease/putative transposase [Alphaproteobacteria bacterium]